MESPKSILYEGTGETLEAAAKAAHCQISTTKPHKDYAVSKVVEWRLQKGGVTGAIVFYVKVIEDEDAQFKSS